MQIPRPLILFIDAYDSFSNNIISLLETTLPCSVRTIKIDNPILLASESALLEELKHYVAVVCGPGPGNPANDGDIGIIETIWKLGDDDMLPVLGICLGFQSLCLEFGANVKRLKGPQHGIIRRVSHIGEHEYLGARTIFEGVGELNATHYQSLCVDFGQDEVKGEFWETTKWAAQAKCPDLVPLAYVENDPSVANDSGVKDDKVLVAVRHKSKPFWALQYHPESICTDFESHKVIKNWFKHAQLWNRIDRNGMIDLESPKYGQFAIRDSLLSRLKVSSVALINVGIDEETTCHSRTVQFPKHTTVPELIEVVQDMGREHILLESTNANEKLKGTADVRGRFSIIALDVDEAPRFEYTTGSDSVNIRARGINSKVDLQNFGGIWPFLAQYIEYRQSKEGNMDSPFWGGFMGYTTYELGLEGIEVESSGRDDQHSRPDLCFAWITRSLVVDHVKKVVHVQELAPRMCPASVETWMDNITKRLARLVRLESSPPSPTISVCSGSGETNFNDTPATTPPRSASSSTTDLTRMTPERTTDAITIINKPNDILYESKVIQCQEHISSGDSYELCLTDQTTVTRSNPAGAFPSWDIYKSLRARQPAPFASYLRLGGATLVSSSPERFLAWDHNNHCSLRPMKGTVRKTSIVDTLEIAKKLLDVPKEKAENLMIVDLVRHDLHGVCGSGNVQVPRLCVVEEYKSVFQMISVVEGQIPAPDPGNESKKHTGLDVLAASLPPGSMTGAPKKRSCEILQGIERGERGLYSGVVGYVDVRGRGDWSVTIRSMFKWDDENSVEGMIGGNGEVMDVDMEKWYIGAGGAVTILSTAVGEREEMQTKLNGTLGIFL